MASREVQVMVLCSQLEEAKNREELGVTLVQDSSRLHFLAMLVS